MDEASAGSGECSSLAKAVMDALDVSGDGSIEYHEFLAAVVDRQRMLTDHTLAEMFGEAPGCPSLTGADRVLVNRRRSGLNQLAPIKFLFSTSSTSNSLTWHMQIAMQQGNQDSHSPAPRKNLLAPCDQLSGSSLTRDHIPAEIRSMARVQTGICGCVLGFGSVAHCVSAAYVDKNKDGLISAQELSDALAESGITVSQATLKQLMSKETPSQQPDQEPMLTEINFAVSARSVFVAVVLVLNSHIRWWHGCMS